MKSKGLRVVCAIGLLMISQTGLAELDSDHSLLEVNHGSLTFSNLNVAQFAALQIFRNTKTKMIEWSSTLRTPYILQVIADKKDALAIHSKSLMDIAEDTAFSVADRNNMIEDISKRKIKPALGGFGFPKVTGIRMKPSLAFNPNANQNNFWSEPEKYIHGPSFWLESAESYQKRMENNFRSMLGKKRDIVFAQEIERGDNGAVNFTETIDSILNEKYSEYACSMPAVPKTSTVITASVTFFRQEAFENVTALYEKQSTELTQKIEYLFGASQSKESQSKVPQYKIQTLALKDRSTNFLYWVVNLHADYKKANEVNTYVELKQIMEEYSNIIVAGDFNLQIDNIKYLENAMKGSDIVVHTLQTPEPVEIGNPTFDAILIKVKNF